MLTEQGLVVSARGDEAIVMTHRSEACEACAAKGACKILGGGKEVEVTALNYIRAKGGDRVELSLPETAFLKASIITYLLPLVAFLAGAVLGQILAVPLGWPADAASITLAGIGLALALGAMTLLNRRMSIKEEYIPRITRVLPSLPELPKTEEADTKEAC